MDDIIQETGVAVDAEVEVGAEVEMIAWPTSFTPRAGHVTW